MDEDPNTVLQWCPRCEAAGRGSFCRHCGHALATTASHSVVAFDQLFVRIEGRIRRICVFPFRFLLTFTAVLFSPAGLDTRDVVATKPQLLDDIEFFVTGLTFLMLVPVETSNLLLPRHSEHFIGISRLLSLSLDVVTPAIVFLAVSSTVFMSLLLTMRVAENRISAPPPMTPAYRSYEGKFLYEGGLLAAIYGAASWLGASVYVDSAAIALTTVVVTVIHYLVFLWRIARASSVSGLEATWVSIVGTATLFASVPFVGFVMIIAAQLVWLWGPPLAFVYIRRHWRAAMRSKTHTSRGELALVPESADRWQNWDGERAMCPYCEKWRYGSFELATDLVCQSCVQLALPP